MVEVLRVEPRSPRLTRITFGGADLAPIAGHEPAASVRLLLPSPGTTEVVLPRWTGNLWVAEDGTRATIRTLTPLTVPGDDHTVAVEIVLHGSGAASTWAANAAPGDQVALSGPGRGYVAAPEATAFVLAGDETALPAITELLERLPSGTTVRAHIEIDNVDARVVLPERSGTDVRWYERTPDVARGDTLLAAVRDEALTETTRIWAAGEAAAMQRIRRHLLEERALPRPHTHVRGYWKHGRAGEEAND
jgi:NADPH-dependent ferric siderophore reductase